MRREGPAHGNSQHPSRWDQSPRWQDGLGSSVNCRQRALDSQEPVHQSGRSQRTTPRRQLIFGAMPTRDIAGRSRGAVQREIETTAGASATLVVANASANVNEIGNGTDLDCLLRSPGQCGIGRLL